ncbi:MAG TPA: pyridoxal-dependent decarboxylase [Planctomycetota bacterium]
MSELPPIFPAGDPEQGRALREHLRGAADRVADYLIGLGTRPLFPAAAQAPAGPLLPERGEPLGQVFGESADWAIDNAIHVGHPGYLGHMDSGVAVAGVMADFLASALNQNLLAFELAPGATLLERALVDLFGAEAGLPDGRGGVFTTGGTGANLAALLCARDAACKDTSRLGVGTEKPLAILASADAHYSIAKAAALLGLGSERVLPVPVAGPERRLDPAALPRVFAAAVGRGMRPIAVVATAGTTSCGALDPIDACADFCEEHGMWLHVDGALGGVLMLHSAGRAKLPGLHRADSIALDPHKWLYAPKSAGVLLLRRKDDLRPAGYEAPYLDRLASAAHARTQSQGRLAIDGSRRFDALKVWMILRHLGRQGIAKLHQDRLELTAWFHQALSEHPFFLPRHRPDLNVQAFGPRDSAREPEVAAAHLVIENQGSLWTSLTRLEQRPSHRVVLLNPAGGRDHLTAALTALEAAHRRVSGPSSDASRGASGPPEGSASPAPSSSASMADPAGD